MTYTAEQVEAMVEQLNIVNIASTEHKASGMLRAYAALLRERRGSLLTGTTYEGLPYGLTGTKESIEAVSDALLELEKIKRERESARAAVTDEMANVAWEAYMNNPYGDDMRAVLEAVAPMLASARVPDGWQLVPIDPTDEMIEKGTDQHECAQGDSWYTDPPLSENDCNAIYKAMLAAAPKPETEE